MSAIRGIVHNGQIVAAAPPDWPERLEVTVSPAEEDVGVGMREEDWPTTPEGIAALLAKMEQIEPWMTPEEDAEWRKALAAQKEWDKAHWDEEGEKMRKAFE